MANCEDDTSYELHPPIIYNPKPHINAVVRFRKYVEDKYNLQLDNYWKLHEWSTSNYPQFWESVWYFFKIIHSQTFVEVFNQNKSFTEMKWFKGAKLNLAENIFRHRDSRIALTTIDEDDNVEKMTYRQMYDEVERYVAALKAFGVIKGDKVACFMSNRKEAVFAFLATVSMGAVWSGALPLTGAKAVISRFLQISPKILFTVDRFSFNKQEFDMLSKLSDIAKGLPTLEKIIIVPSKKESLKKDLSSIPNSCFLPQFLELSRESDGSVPSLEFEQVDFDYPVTISYTSGTTGTPKALVHSFGSLFATLRDFGLQFSCTREDVVLSISPVGWITWNMYTNCLFFGLTLCLYEGTPYVLSPTYFWDLVHKLKVTVLMLPASVLEDFSKRSYIPNSDRYLKSLRVLVGSASPVKPQSFDFAVKSIKEGVCFTSLYGSTELLGFLSGLDTTMPIHRGELQCFALGIDARCVDEKGNYLIGKRGDLVIANPLPSLPIFLCDDPDKKKIGSYLRRYPGHWDQNDECWINPVTKGFIVMGRSDETMNPKGSRYSSSEIYAALDDFDEVEDCLCASQQNAVSDERAVLFLKMVTGVSFTRDLEQKIRETITKELSARHVPEIILETPEIPYNLNGKKMELLVKRIISKRPIPSPEAVINPSSLDFYADVPELRNF